MPTFRCLYLRVDRDWCTGQDIDFCYQDIGHGSPHVLRLVHLSPLINGSFLLAQMIRHRQRLKLEKWSTTDFDLVATSSMCNPNVRSIRDRRLLIFIPRLSPPILSSKGTYWIIMAALLGLSRKTFFWQALVEVRVANISFFIYFLVNSFGSPIGDQNGKLGSSTMSFLYEASCRADFDCRGGLNMTI